MLFQFQLIYKERMSNLKDTILCVDDEVIILESLKGQLKRHFGDIFNYEFAQSADEALELIDELTEDRIRIIIIVSDWLMPGIKGDEFLVKIHNRFPKTIKIMITGQADQCCINNAFKNANLFRCFSKPWDEETLIKSIQEALETILIDKAGTNDE